MSDAYGEYPVADLALARRLESAEGRSGVAFVEARARTAPERGAAWCEVDGALAMFDGVGSPITQTFALGLAGPVSPDALARLEAFFDERGAEPLHEISPLADPSLLFSLLPGRGYRPVELTSVTYQPIRREALAGPGGPPDIRVRPIEPGEAGRWAETAAGGWASEGAELGAFVRELGEVTASSAGTVSFLAEVGGEAIAAGSLSIRDGVAVLAGASTRPEWRGRGAQGALLRARLHHAAEAGCDLAMMGALPGSASQRNAERQGFRIAYTRIKWGRGASA
jgi:GNAT superfamily N-acetyltransferase